MSALVHHPDPDVTLDGLEDALADAFALISDAVAQGRPVVIVVDDEDVAGTGDPARAAFAHGLLGLARAFGVEGRKPGWRVSVLACGAGLAPEVRDRWVARLADPHELTGWLVRLGDTHLGRLPT